MNRHNANRQYDPLQIHTAALNPHTGGMSLPYGAFSHSATQTSAGTTSANLVLFNTDEYKSSITHSTSSNTNRIYTDMTGVYLITFSVCMEASGVNKHIVMWLQVDGSAIARTGTVLETPISGEVLFTVTYIQSMTAGHYFDLAWASRDDANMVLKATAVGSNPTTPASPSIILTVNKISN